MSEKDNTKTIYETECFDVIQDNNFLELKPKGKIFVDYHKIIERVPDSELYADKKNKILINFFKFMADEMSLNSKKLESLLRETSKNIDQFYNETLKEINEDEIEDFFNKTLKKVRITIYGF